MKGLFKRLFCKHDYQFVRNLHGDEVRYHGWKRSVWRCSKCGKVRYESWYVAYKKRGLIMAAKDYRVCCALFNAYIAKVSKRNPNMMLNDRREITEGEILMLIDWYLDKEIDEDSKQAIHFDSLTREGMKVEMQFVPAQKKGEE